MSKSREELENRLDRAFAEDFERLGPSLFRMMKVHFDGYIKTRDWDHELVQMRRADMKKTFLVYIPILHAMDNDLRSMGHLVADEVRRLKEAMIQELGMRGQLMATLAGPLVQTTMQIEKLHYRFREKTQRGIDPRCHLTHYANFEHKYPLWMPKAEACPEVVAIRRRVEVDSAASVTSIGERPLAEPLYADYEETSPSVSSSF